VSWWTTLTPQIQGALIGAAATALAAVLGFTAIFIQLGRQARNAIAQNRENERTKLKLKIYEDIVAICAQASDAEITFSGYIRSYLMNVSIARSLQKQGQSYSIPRERFPEMNELNSAASRSAIGVISTVERWTVIDPRVDIFRVAMSVALHEVQEAFTGKFVPAVIRTMPIQHPQTGELFPWSPPPDQVIEELDSLGNGVIDALGLIGNVLFDFQVEMQNLLLGELFSGRAERRDPLDPKYIVTRIDRHGELLKQFETQTAWGLHKAEIEARVRAQETSASKQ
jgi:hypothetical protein